MSEPLSPEEAKLLTSLCCEGKLYEIEKWISSGKSLRVPPAFKRTPLEIAIDQEFHSLIELLARNETSREVKNGALAVAVSMRRLEYVHLLLDHGAEIRGVPLADVLLTWEPALIRLFLDKGADVLTDSPFSVAFGSKIRTALRPFLEYKKTHPDLANQLQEQADRALRYFCYKGEMKWISLLLWAGADARSLGPTLEKEYTNDPECFTTGLREASYSGNVEVLKKLKPDSARDNLNDLLHCAAVSGHTDAIRYLLEVGANPNDKPNGGSSALDTCLWHLNFGSFALYTSKRLRSKYEVSKGLDCAREMVAHGAVWNPEDQSGLNSLRRSLYGCAPEVTIELLQVFQKLNACPPERLRELLRKPRMREHLASQAWHLTRLSLRYEEKRTSKRQLPPAHLLREYNREELYERVWAEPARRAAKHYGFSDVRLGKVCRALWVPVPGRG